MAHRQLYNRNIPSHYTHCRSHALNLAIVKSCSVQEIRNMIDVINETFLFFSGHQSVRDF